MSDQDKCIQEFEKWFTTYLADDERHWRISLELAWQAAWKARDAEVGELREHKVYYNRMFSKSVVVKTEEYSEMVNKIKQLETQLSEARTVIEFYGNKKSWNLSPSDRDRIDCEDLEELGSDFVDHCGGKRARAWLNKDNELNE